MKQTILVIALAFLVNAAAAGQDVVDDIYYTPSDAKKEVKQEAKKPVKQMTSYKNGARKIIFVERDTVDSYADVSKENTVAYDEEGYYLNGFEGSESDYEYAERIHRFHNPKYTVFISDPNYNDIYFLDDNYWNVYIDGSYAYITPTWTNPYWFDYMYRPYAYNSWYWRNSWYYGYPYSWSSYWGWGGYYGGWYGGYYDPYYWGYGWGYGHGHSGYWGGGYRGGDYGHYNPFPDREPRRDRQFGNDRTGAGNRQTSTTIGGGYAPNTGGRDGNIANLRGSNGTRTSAVSNRRDAVAGSRETTLRPNVNLDNQARQNATRPGISLSESNRTATATAVRPQTSIDTRSRTAFSTDRATAAGSRTATSAATRQTVSAPSSSNATRSVQSGASSSRQTTTSTPSRSYSTGTPARSYSTSTPASSSSSRTSSTPSSSSSSSRSTYSAPSSSSSSSSSGSYSSGSSRSSGGGGSYSGGGGSRSSGGGGGRR